MKIFWSWQSDRDARVCRHLIFDALSDAVKKLADASDINWPERPEIDHDTKNTPGLVDIAATIFRKIDESDLFVADVTPIADSPGDKALANPNVLIELGYAIRALGVERIITVANSTWFAGPETLPFDLRHRRSPITYRAAPSGSSQERQAARRELSIKLEEAIRLNLKDYFALRDRKANFACRLANEHDRGSWFEPRSVLRVRDYFRPDVELELTPMDGPRAYMRLIPSSWPSGKPTRDAVRTGPEKVGLHPFGRWSSASSGINADGVMAWAPPEAGSGVCQLRSLTQWFSDTGELWGVDFDIGEQEEGGVTISSFYAMKRYFNFIRYGAAFFKAHGASDLLRIEAGLTNLDFARWPLAFKRRAKALRRECFHQEDLRAPTEGDMDEFICALYNVISDNFGIGGVPREQLLADIARTI